MQRSTRLLTALIAVPLVLTACSSGGSDTPSGGGDDGGGGKVELTYWLWDSLQKPAYEECAASFTEANPDITIKIEQYGTNALLE